MATNCLSQRLENGVPLIAILRGVCAEEVLAIGEALLDAGITIIEVPLNSPDAFSSIAQLTKHFGKHAAIGAGTVLQSQDVEHLAKIGAEFAVAPNTSASVIKACHKCGLTPVPGVFSPSEAIAAVEVGAQTLKLFPASHLGPAYLSDLKAVLPPETQLLAVGGIRAPDMETWIAAGACGFGIGSALYKPNVKAIEVFNRARNIVRVYLKLNTNCTE